MHRIVRLGVVLAAALSLAAVGAASVSATGHEFIASKTGKTKSKQYNEQVFKTSAGTIECTTAAGSGEITELKSAIHKEVITYSGCSGFGYSIITISPAHFEFSANGSARLETAITIQPEGASCHVVIPAQTIESGLSYTNESPTLRAGANTGKIKVKGTGGECGGESSTGSYAGRVSAELEGGTLEWK